MAWDLATAKIATGIAPADATHDVALQRALDVVLSTVEDHLGRGLLLRREKVRFLNVDTRRFLLPRYPINTVYDVSGASVSDLIIQHRVGWIELRDGAAGANRELEVDYAGGFDPLPSDLEHALWEAFGTFWAGIDPLTGYPVPGSGPSVVAGSGDVSKLVLPDGGSVTFDVASQISGGSSSSGIEVAQGIWGWLAPWASVLSIYRSEAAPSVAFA